MPVQVCVWGLVSLLTSQVKTAGQIIATRFILGFVEAPFFPGILFYLSKWVRTMTNYYLHRHHDRPTYRSNDTRVYCCFQLCYGLLTRHSTQRKSCPYAWPSFTPGP